MAVAESAVTIGNITENQGSASTSQDTEARNRLLYHAAVEGNWNAAKKILHGDSVAATARITKTSMTALHVAAREGQCEFVEKMVAEIDNIDLKTKDKDGFTALHHAAISGSVRTASALVKQDPDLTNVVDNKGQTPLLVGSRFVYGNYDVLRYLTLVTRDAPNRPFTGSLAMDLVHMLVLSGAFDILLYLVNKYESLATATTSNGASLLSLLAMTPSNFLSGLKLGFLESFIYIVLPTRNSYEPSDSVRRIVMESREKVCQQLPETCLTLLHQVLQQLPSPFFFFPALRVVISTETRVIKRLQTAKHKHQCAIKLFEQVSTMISKTNGSLMEYFLNKEILYQATSLGIVELLHIMFRICPDLMWASIKDGKSPIHVAIEHQRENIFKLLREKSARNKIVSDCVTSSGVLHEKNARDKIESDRVTSSGAIMHLAAKLSPFEQLSAVSGAALQMQQEMKWFKEVENLVPPFFRTWKNIDDKTAQEVFSDEHKNLAKDGEKWIKDTSSSCMIVSTLIATVVFAAASEVPGGTKSNNRIPFFLCNDAFLVFVVSDALALFSSLTAVLMFLSILTARCTEEDFMVSLPTRLIIGLASLFLATTAMMVTFGATLAIVLDERLRWIVAPTFFFASVPVMLFAFLQLPLFIQMVRSTLNLAYNLEARGGDLSY